MNEELELYKLIMMPDSEDREFLYTDEIGWEGNRFLVWISYLFLDDFMSGLKSIFGYGLFDDGGFRAYMQADCVCIDLVEALGCFLDIEKVFPKDEFKH